MSTPPPIDLTPPHTIMDMQNSKRRNGLTSARVNFSQSETSWRGGWLNFELLLWEGGGELTENIQIHFQILFTSLFWTEFLYSFKNPGRLTDGNILTSHCHRMVAALVLKKVIRSKKTFSLIHVVGHFCAPWRSINSIFFHSGENCAIENKSVPHFW